MRLRIQTLPPLPDLKAWFIPEAQKTPNSIREFKELLCSSVTVLKEAGVSPREILLLLDDFELLNESSFASALRDGDLLCLKAPLSSHKALEIGGKDIRSSLPPKKRKHVQEREKVHKKLKKSNPRKAIGSDSESDGSSTDSSSSSSSSSSSASSSSSSSNSHSSSDESDSSSSSAPSPKPSKSSSKLQNNNVPLSPPDKIAAVPLGPFVPPGYGKATTHARNLRRKRSRAAQAQQRAESFLQQTHGATIPPHLLSQTNTIPLGEKASVTAATQAAESSTGKEKQTDVEMEMDVSGVATEYDVPERQEVMMASLGNKNKKKGYKQFLMAPVPKKIVFMEDGQPVISLLSPASASTTPPISQPSTSRLIISSSSTSIPPQAHKQGPRLIPPSEIQERGELPPNMFVTSVDVEADLWTPNGKKMKKKRENRYDYHYSYTDESGHPAEEEVTLPYGIGENEIVGDGAPLADDGSSSKEMFDWNQAEQLFESAPKVSQMSDLKTGQIVGWKSLDLNPQTFTPEILLIAAKIIECTDGVSVKTQRLVRPIDPESGFLAPVDHDANGGEVEGEVEEYQWADVLASDWRALKTS